MKQMLATAILSTGILALVPAPAHAATLQEAVQNYNAGKFGPALHEFEEVSRTGRGQEAIYAHYYMALCLQSMGQYERAKVEYAWVGAYGDQKMKAMAQAGAAQLGVHNQPAQSQSFASAPASGGKIRRILEFTADY